MRVPPRQFSELLTLGISNIVSTGQLSTKVPSRQRQTLLPLVFLNNSRPHLGFESELSQSLPPTHNLAASPYSGHNYPNGIDVPTVFNTHCWIFSLLCMLVAYHHSLRTPPRFLFNHHSCNFCPKVFISSKGGKRAAELYGRTTGRVRLF